jgi:DNA-binding MarR family transcriptional regulator
MPDFAITPEGWVREEAIHDAALRAARLFPEVDPVTFEASTLLIRVFKAVRDGGEAYLEPFGLTPSRIPVLETIHRSDEKRLTIREIADALKVTPTNVSKLIDALERDGWVRKIPNPDDGRSTYAELTDFAIERLEELVPQLTARRTEIWSVLTKEEKQILAHLLAKLHMNILAKSPTWSDLGLSREESLAPA